MIGNSTNPTTAMAQKRRGPDKPAIKSETTETRAASNRALNRDTTANSSPKAPNSSRQKTGSNETASKTDSRIIGNSSVEISNASLIPTRIEITDRTEISLLRSRQRLLRNKKAVSNS